MLLRSLGTSIVFKKPSSSIFKFGLFCGWQINSVSNLIDQTASVNPEFNGKRCVLSLSYWTRTCMGEGICVQFSLFPVKSFLMRNCLYTTLVTKSITFKAAAPTALFLWWCFTIFCAWNGHVQSMPSKCLLLFCSISCMPYRRRTSLLSNTICFWLFDTSPFLQLEGFFPKFHCQIKPFFVPVYNIYYLLKHSSYDATVFDMPEFTRSFLIFH